MTEFNEMQSQNRFFDDLSKVLNGLAGTVAGVGREAESSARERAKEWFGGMDFVSRDEFDAVKEMAAKGATFTLNGKEISAKKAIQVIQKNDKINIDTRGSKNKKPTVKLSVDPIVIDN